MTNGRITSLFFEDGEQDFSDGSNQTEDDHEDEPEDNDSSTSGVDKMPVSASHSDGHNGLLAVSRRSDAHNIGSMQLFQTSQSSFGTNSTGESGDLCVDLGLIGF